MYDARTRLALTMSDPEARRFLNRTEGGGTDAGTRLPANTRRQPLTAFEAGDRVETPDGPGAVVGPFLSRGLRRHGDLEADGWIVALDTGKRRVIAANKIQPA
jgi:hypothetical protein